MTQTIELQLTIKELAEFIAELYKQGLAYRFTNIGLSTYRFDITGF